MVKEIDTRPILGNGGSIMLVSNDEGYCVNVVNWEGEQIAAITAANTAEALDAYRHPFARPEVPDIFKRIPDLEAVEIEEEDGEEVPV